MDGFAASGRPSQASAVVERDLGRSPPDAARRDLDEREQVPARVGEGRGRVLRIQLGQRAPELGPGARPLGEESGSVGEDGAEVDAAQRRRMLRMTGQLPVEHGLDERAEEEAVVGADEVDRRPHDDGPHDPPLHEELGERLGPEPLEARPESRVRVEGNLGLEADEVLDRLEGRHGRAAKEQLALERRPVQSPQAEDLTARHVGRYDPTRTTRFAATPRRTVVSPPG